MSTLQTTRDYVFGVTASDRERLELQHRIFRPSFLRLLQFIFDEAGLANHFSTSKLPQILDVGCGEGLYLQDVADFLDTRKFSATLTGIDLNPNAISTAEQFSKAKGRPNINFFLQDATQPFKPEINSWLGLTDEAAFDLIYSILVVEYLTPASLHIKNLYNKLRSGGVLYIRSFVPDRPNRFDGSKVGWVSKLPALDALFEPLGQYIASCNDNQQVATSLADWLNDVGADVVYRANVRIPIGGPTEYGKQFLKDFVYAIKNARKLLETKGYMSAERFAELEAQLYEQMGNLPAENEVELGHIYVTDTVVRHP